MEVYRKSENSFLKNLALALILKNLWLRVVRCLNQQVPFAHKKLKIRVAFCIIVEIDRRAVPIGASQSDENVPMASQTEQSGDEKRNLNLTIFER